MKIVYVLEHYYPHVGGVETLFQTVAEAMVKLGHTVTVCTARMPDTAKEEIFNGVRIIRVPVPAFGRRYFFTFFAPFFIWPAIRKSDIVHTTTYNAVWPAWLVAKIFHRPLILSVQEVWIELWGKLPGMSSWAAWLHGLYERFIYKLLYARVIVGSHHTAAALEQVNRKYKTEVVYHGVEIPAADQNISRETIRREWPIETSDFVLLYFGRPGWAKGVEVALQGFALAVREQPRLKFILLLSNNPIDRYRTIQQMVVDLNLQKKITILPSCPRNQLANYIQASDAVIVPSLSEGFGFSAAEACLLGQPVIVSKAASLPEVVSGQVIFFSPGDQQACAQAIISAIHGEWKKIPKKVFPWAKTVESFVRIYIETIEPTVSRPINNDTDTV